MIGGIQGAASEGGRTAPVIAVKELTKRFGDKTVVDGLTMRIKPGQLYGFLGPNGSGKTTAIRMMCGLVPPTSGRGMCLGYDISRQSHRIKPLLGYMTQHFSLYKDLTVQENLRFVCRLYGLPNPEHRVQELIQQFAFDAEDRATQRVGNMSGGWKQRLALACAMAHRPRILLLDEPTAGVDPKAREAFWDILQEIAATGVSVLVSTHYMDEAMRSNRIAYVLYGRLLVDDTPERVLHGSDLVAAQVPLHRPFHNPALAHDPRIVRLSMQGNSLRVVARRHEDIGSWCRELGDQAGQPIDIDVGLEDVFFYLTLRQQGEGTRF